MKAKNVKYTDDLMAKIKKVRSGGYRDPDMVKLNIGEGKPAKNIMRPLGEFVNTQIHYLRDYIGEDAGVSRMPVCPGREICPVCAAATQLYGIGTEASREKAKQLFSNQRLYWNVLPRWDYEWDEDGGRFLVLSFGVNACRSLQDVVADYGNPGDIEEGFDLNYEAQKKKGGYGNETRFLAIKKRKQTREGKGSIVVPKPLTEEELDYDVVDLSKYTDDPTEEELEILADIFSTDVTPPSRKKRRAEMDEDEDEDDEDVLDLDDEDEDDEDEGGDEDTEDEDDEDDEGEDLLCYGDSDVFKAKSSTCKKCPEFLGCQKEVRKELLGKK